MMFFLLKTLVVACGDMCGREFLLWKCFLNDRVAEDVNIVEGIFLWRVCGAVVG